MFHELLALFRAYVLFSTTFIATSNVLSIQMPFLVVENTQFSCGVDISFCGSYASTKLSLFIARGRLSFFVACKSSILFCQLQRIVKCSNNVIVKFIRVFKFAKSSQVKSTSFVDMHVAGRNM
jgi:hypothetical protein